MHQALYRKYRPSVFDDVCGQKHITDVLRHEVKTGTVNHAYLFCGSRGTGKTTCAKILAKAVNCLNAVDGNPCCECDTCRAIDAGLSVDVLEMDAASNTGVDYIRDIKENISFSASETKNKVFIIDEVHMLTTSAFNALLKTLEEPPANVIFILATTEMQKIPATVLSRCQRFDFRRISNDVIAKRLEYIAGKEGFAVDEDAAGLIAVLSRGGMRDAISMLELCAASNNHITVNDVREAVGVAGRDDVIAIFDALVARDIPAVFSVIDMLNRSSKDLYSFMQDVLSFYRDMVLMRACAKIPDKTLFELTESEYTATAERSRSLSSEVMLYHIEVIEKTLTAISRASSDNKLLCEMAFVQMSTPSLDTTPRALLARISVLESGIPTAAAQKSAAVINKAKPVSENKQGKQAEVQKSDADETPCAYWSDVLTKLLKADPASGGFAQHTRAYKRGDVLRVYTADSFAKNMISGEGAVSAILGIVKTFDNEIDKIEIEVKEEAKKDNAENDGIEMFLRSSGEDLI